MDKITDDKIDPEAASWRRPQPDFDHNPGLFSGLLKPRDPQSPGPEAKQPYPPR